jgi:hypothetical protein
VTSVTVTDLVASNGGEPAEGRPIDWRFGATAARLRYPISRAPKLLNQSSRSADGWFRTNLIEGMVNEFATPEPASVGVHKGHLARRIIATLISILLMLSAGTALLHPLPAPHVHRRSGPWQARRVSLMRFLPQDQCCLCLWRDAASRSHAGSTDRCSHRPCGGHRFRWPQGHARCGRRGRRLRRGSEQRTIPGTGTVRVRVNHLNGETALGFVRERHQLSLGDISRGRRRLAGYSAHGCRWAGWVWPGVAQQVGQRRRGESSASANACRDRAWSSVTSWWSRRALSNQSW